MRRLQLAGHRPIGLVGGATGLVGDPSGRTSERALHGPRRDRGLGRAHPVAGRALPRLRAVRTPAVIVNNLEWTAELSAIDWLRDIGKHFSVSRMLGQGVGRRAPRGGRHQLYRVQLPGHAGARLPGAVPAPRLHAPAGRERPVGQPHGRRRPHPTRRGRPGARAGDPAHHPARRREVRQEHRLDAVAGSCADHAVRLLPVVPQHR